MTLSPFTKHGKALRCEVCEMIVQKWLEGSSDFVTNSIYGESWDSSCEWSRVPVHNQWVPDQKTGSA